LPAPQFVAAAYGFIWVALLGYVFFVARGLSRTQAELAEMRRRVDRATGGTDPR
jgi:CcmD family protein